MGNLEKGLAIKITNRYRTYYADQISNNRFTHSTFIAAIEKFNKREPLTISDAGYSHEGRVIKSITFGKGKTKVLLWSQMHGNESTATRAILDILNFLVADDEFNLIRAQISKELTLQFIPMLNPDGTERFQRRAASEIDMNRDALALQTPEGKLLMNVVNKFKPDFGFNLHDQRRFYNVKGTEVPSSISFLAPAYNEARNVNASRTRAMQVIVGMNAALQQYIPSGVGLYDDTYSFRSFGDQIQAKGVSTILIESGWMKNDMEKEAIRKLNFTGLVSAFTMISDKSFANYKIEEYEAIPPIDTKLFDVLIKNATVKNAKMDIGVNRTEHLLKAPNYYSLGKIEDLGDLSAHYGFEIIEAEGLTVVPGKSLLIKNLSDINRITVKRLLKQGILFAVTEEVPLENHVPFPINVLHPRKLKEAQSIKFDSQANFLLVDKANKIKYIVLNGFFLNPSKIDTSANGFVIL